VPNMSDSKRRIGFGPNTRSPRPPADRILIIRLGALGDVVRTLPAVVALRSVYPGAHLTWLVEPASAGVVEAAGVVDETLVFPRGELMESIRAADGLSFARKLVKTIRRLRDRRFDLALDFHGLLKSGILARISGAPIRVGFGRAQSRELSHLFANRHVDLGLQSRSRYDRNAALVAALSRDAVIPERPFLQPSPLAAARLAARLRISNREKAGGFVLIHPGSSAGARHKRYAPSAWSDVARRLADDGIPVWVASGPTHDERLLVEAILKQSAGAGVPAPESRGFDDLLALISRASVFASCDSGPLHAASLVGTPVVQVLGPTDPIHNAPWAGTPFGRVRVPLPCSPCRRGCAAAACMRTIPPVLVFDEISRMHNALAQPAVDAVELPS
jgi:heptosyltransferase-1